LSAFLKPTGDEGEFTFFHQQFYVAITKRYLSIQHQVQKYHTMLADFFYERSDPAHSGTWQRVRAIHELAHHLINTEKWDELVIVLTDLAFVELKAGLGQIFDLIEDYNAATAKSHNSANYKGKKLVREFKSFVKAAANVIQHNPTLTFQQTIGVYSHPDAQSQESEVHVESSSQTTITFSHSILITRVSGAQLIHVILKLGAKMWISLVMTTMHALLTRVILDARMFGMLIVMIMMRAPPTLVMLRPAVLTLPLTAMIIMHAPQTPVMTNLDANM
jgi:hypothetical protein